jgi:hypothetical protein
MAVLYLTLATLLLIAAPILAAAVVFYIAFPWWIDRILKSHPGAQERLRLDVSEGRVAWSIRPSETGPRPYLPIFCAALVGIAVIAAQAALFASASRVPLLWYAAGACATAVTVLASLTIASVFKRPLARMTDRALKRHANSTFWFAAEAIVDACEVSQHIDMVYESIGLKSQINVENLCAQALFKHLRSGQDIALAWVIEIRDSADSDLRNLQYFARMLSNMRVAIENAKLDASLSGDSRVALAQIDNEVHSRDLLEALEDARWPHADKLLEAISFELGRVLNFAGRADPVPKSLQDAYLVLNVSDDTPLENIKAVVNNYRRIWHPDLAHNDDVKQQRHVLRMQQINVAWDIIQKARIKRLSHASGKKPTANEP